MNVRIVPFIFIITQVRYSIQLVEREEVIRPEMISRMNRRNANKMFISIDSVFSMTNMSHHRLYIQFFLILILTRPLLSFECDEDSNQDGALFPTKVQQSPVVVLGTSLNKNIDNNIRNLFNVTFRVECILKGRPTQRIIHIVQAGE